MSTVSVLYSHRRVYVYSPQSSVSDHTKTRLGQLGLKYQYIQCYELTPNFSLSNLDIICQSFLRN